ncbi:aminopeptidase [Gudongella sp. DL1XJH-153]|uniref:aminopeptidase n=1 Tax=Gudongella sp. DL1XJH-153 TaxID=3409804 RepID=UPI003BB5675D
MKSIEERKRDYARLIINFGVNIQKGEPLVVKAPIEGADFVRMLAEEAYLSGSSDVHINWSDDTLTRLKYDNAPMEVFEEYPKWKADSEKYYAEKGAAFISISANDPQLLQGVDSKKIAAFNKAAAIANKENMKYTMNDLNSWCVVSIPTTGWAKRLFPEIPEEDAVKKLWEAIFEATRMNMEDPLAAWDEHLDSLTKRVDYMNSMNFQSLHYKASNGTDLHVKLPNGHIWMGGGGDNAKGDYFVANIPTEEVFTLPHKDGVDGVVYSSKPLNRSGNTIDNFKLVFKNGEVVEYNAEKGIEFLTELLEMDEGAKRLGEVALVPFSSPIEKAGILFLNSLFDENASCHFAFGKAYPTTIKNGPDMSDDELTEHGVNNSLTHVDFMIGTSDLDITGITESGEKIQIFKDGEWTI